MRHHVDNNNNDDDDDDDDADVLIFCCFRSRRIRSCHFCFGLQSCLRSLSDMEILVRERKKHNISHDLWCGENILLGITQYQLNILGIQALTKQN